MTRYFTLVLALGGALIVFTDMGPKSANAAVTRVTSGYCPLGTCAIGGGKYARYPVRNCKASHCFRD
jgi:hypothetical protein